MASVNQRVERLEGLQGEPFEVVVVSADGDTFPQNGRNRETLLAEARAKVGEDGSLLVITRPVDGQIAWEWERCGGHVITGTIQAPSPTAHEDYAQLFSTAREILDAHDTTR